MHTEVEFQVHPKTETGKGHARRVRAEGQVPAIVYGYNAEPAMVTFREQDLVKALSTPAGKNVFLRLKCEDKNLDGVRTMVKEFQVHPLKRRFVHADLYRLDPDREINTKVPIKLEGTAAGVKLGGIMQVARRDLAVICLPDDLPEAITVDVTALMPGESIHVGDLESPKGVKITASPKLAVCAVIAPSKQEEAAEEEGEEVEREEEAAEETEAEE